ncbi:hypothetical protein CRT23_26045 [Methylobacterium sp. V23]|jgi:hypothetical protein|nr:hypothetical protein CRT23_26045 [Methylobacterium sp. V23]
MTFRRTMIATVGIVGAIACSAGASQAHPLAHNLHATQDRGDLTTGAISPVSSIHDFGEIGPRDDDGANARNPALPAYERGMGQETGGPARMLIPD